MAPTFDQCNTRRNDTYFQLQKIESAILFWQSSYQLLFTRIWAISCCLLTVLARPLAQEIFCCVFLLFTNALLSYRSHLGGNQTLDHVIWSDLGTPPLPSTRTTQFTLGIYKQYIIVIEGVSQRKRQFLYIYCMKSDHRLNFIFTFEM